MVIQPNSRFMLSHPAHFVALGFGTGLAPVAPGTVGTLLGFALYAVLLQWFSPYQLFLSLPVLFAIGIGVCAKTAESMGISDHSSMVWDEIVASFLILTFTPPGLAWQAFAFFVFRAFDVLKPPPIRAMERRWKGGFGVMADDIVAAFYTLLVLAAAKALLN